MTSPTSTLGSTPPAMPTTSRWSIVIEASSRSAADVAAAIPIPVVVAAISTAPTLPECRDQPPSIGTRRSAKPRTTGRSSEGMGQRTPTRKLRSRSLIPPTLPRFGPTAPKGPSARGTGVAALPDATQAVEVLTLPGDARCHDGRPDHPESVGTHDGPRRGAAITRASVASDVTLRRGRQPTAEPGEIPRASVGPGTPGRSASVRRAARHGPGIGVSAHDARWWRTACRGTAVSGARTHQPSSRPRGRCG